MQHIKKDMRANIDTLSDNLKKNGTKKWRMAAFIYKKQIEL